MSIYIQSASQISTQQPLCEEWMQQPILPVQAFNPAQEPDYKQFVSAVEARRMGKLLKRAVAVSLDTLQKGHCDMPDAIISGTGLGCVENTEKFLNAVIDNDEECLSPTPFMQSTHNTISSQVSLKLQCHGYNSTYSHRGTSFDSALLDAVMQFEMGQIRTALVGGYDEMTPAYFDMLGKLNYWRKDGVSLEALKESGKVGSISGNAAVSVLLGDERTQDTMCQLVDMEMMAHSDTEELHHRILAFLQRCGIEGQNISAVMCGLSGDEKNDSAYREMLSGALAEAPTLWYKHLFGESFCASGYGIYASAVCLKNGIIPDALRYNSAQKQSTDLKNILVINHFQERDYSLVLLSI